MERRIWLAQQRGTALASATGDMSMRKHLLAMASVTALGLATSVGAAHAISLAPIGSDSSVIQIQDRGDRGGGGGGGGGEMGRGGGSGGSGVSGRSGGDAGASGGRDVRGGAQVQRNEGPRVQRNEATRVQRNEGPRAHSTDRVTRLRGDGQRSINRGDGDRQISRDFNRGHRHVNRGWSRDRRHIFYGAALIGVPFGYAAYASHPCYDWLAGPRGVGYYWSYDRCPV
jgi:hypothetical protein